MLYSYNDKFQPRAFINGIMFRSSSSIAVVGHYVYSKSSTNAKHMKIPNSLWRSFQKLPLSEIFCLRP